MKTTSQVIFILSLAMWFLNAIYLSFIFLLNNFIEFNPTISKSIFTTSFIFIIVTGIYNHFTNNSPLIFNKNDKGPINAGGCKTCKQKVKNGDV